MPKKWIKPLGEAVAPDSLRLPKARELVAFLKSGANPYATFREARKAERAEVVVFEVEVELGQLQAYPIESLERLAVVFFEGDADIPEVLALRKDFPQVPHRNVRPFELPRSLCLYEEKYAEIKRSWTAARFTERVRMWLALTAKGRLHAQDQPLEPFIEVSTYTLAVPKELITEASKPLERILVRYVSESMQEGLLIAERSDDVKTGLGLQCVATVFNCPAQTHGVIEHKPANLGVLHALVSKAGLDLIGQLRNRFEFWKEDDRKLLDSKLIVIVTFPKTRIPGGHVETIEARAFMISKSILEIGVAIGMWQLQGGEVGVCLPTDITQTGQSVEVELVNVTYNLSRSSAANANAVKPDARKIVAIGAGALGSQVVMNLIRSGFGEWTIIDNDCLLPHNLARHVLDGRFLGKNKATSLQFVANTIFGPQAVRNAINTDVLHPQDKPALEQALSNSSAIVDLSASVSIGRYLACDLPAKNRRISAFLNPAGTDLVVLGEDLNRKVPLDALEMQYYRALACDPSLAGHLDQSPGKVRYAQSCRDISSEVSQEVVAALAGVASRAIRNSLTTESQTASVWRTSKDDLAITKIDIPTSEAALVRIGGWSVCLDEMLKTKLFDLRAAKLPKETGGVLLGSYDLERKILYIFHTLGSPPDSEEWPTVYIRGSEGLAASVEAVAARTHGMLEYVGEWHSHPNRCSCRPSNTDKVAFMDLTRFRSRDGLPACMMIIGEKSQYAMYVGEMK